MTPMAGPVVRYVTPNGAGSGSCSAWVSSCTLQYALSIAAWGEQVWVAKGTYTPTTGSDRTFSFELRDGVAIYGGFAGTEMGLRQRQPTVNVTILSGDLGAAGDPADNSYHVVTASGVTGTAVLDGFTVTGGNAANAQGMRGGGMLIENASPILRNLIFRENTAVTGGGLYLDHASPILSTVTFSHNTADERGGGMANFNKSNPTLMNTVFNGNSTPWSNSNCQGGGMYNNGSSPMLTKVDFYANSSSHGGGMMNLSSNLVLTNVNFLGNSGRGMLNGSSNAVLKNVNFIRTGGMANFSNSNVTLDAVTFSGNRSTNPGAWGAAMLNDHSKLLLSNVTFEGNSVAFGGGGGGMFNLASRLSFNNVTFTHNTGEHGAGMYNADSWISVANSIFWDDVIKGEIVNDNSHAIISNSIVQGGCPGRDSDCHNVLNADPLLGPLQDNGGFVWTMALGPGSAAIDAGGRYGHCEPADARGVARPQGAACDLGAYEVGH